MKWVLIFNKYLNISVNEINVCTQEEIRTPTPLRAPAPQAGASTNFATWVGAVQI